MEKTTLTTRKPLPKADGTRVFVQDIDGEAELIQYGGFWYRMSDLSSGKLRVGGSGDWFSTVYWSDQAWAALHRRNRAVLG